MHDDLKQQWQFLRDRMEGSEPGVSQGRLMSADALTFDGKVFAFFSTKGGRVGLGCRVGRDLDLEALNLSDWQHLAPFKTRPPMKDWIVLGEGDRSRWDELAQLCLTLARERGV
ncbi:MAG: hypothetical protein AAF511_12395 [Pseudomonadota bacterium]